MVEHSRRSWLTKGEPHCELAPPLSPAGTEIPPAFEHAVTVGIQFWEWFSENSQENGCEVVWNSHVVDEDEEMRDVSPDVVVQQQGMTGCGDIEMEGIEQTICNDLPPTVNRNNPSSQVLISMPSSAEMAEFYPAFATAVEQRYTQFDPDVYALPGSAKKATLGDRYYSVFVGAVEDRYGNLDPAIYGVAIQARKYGVAIESYPVFAAAVQESYSEFDPQGGALPGQAREAIRDDEVILGSSVMPIEISEGGLEVDTAQNFEKPGDALEEFGFVTAVADLQNSLWSRTVDAHYPNRRKFIDSNGKLHGYDDFPAEEVIENPYTATSSFPLQNHSAADLDLTRYPPNNNPFINDLYYTDALEETLDNIDRGIFPILDGVPNDPEPAPPRSGHGGERKRYISPISRSSDHGVRNKWAQQEGWEAESDISDSLNGYSPLGNVDEGLSLRVQHFTIVDGVFYGPFPDSPSQALHSILPLDDEELIKAGTNFVRQILGALSSPGEASNDLVSPAIREWLESSYHQRRLSERLSGHWESNDLQILDEYSGPGEASNDLFPLEIGEFSRSRDYLKRVAKGLIGNTEGNGSQLQNSDYLQTVTPPREHHPPLKFGRCFSPPLQLALKYRKNNRKFEISNEEFDKLLGFFDGEEQQQSSEVLSETLEDIVMEDFDMEGGDTTDDDEAEQSGLGETPITNPTRAPSSGRAIGPRQKPELRLFNLSAAPNSNQKTADINHRSKTYSIPFGTHQGNLSSLPPSPIPGSNWTQGGSPRIMRTLQPSPSSQPPTPNSRASHAGIRQVANSDGQSNFIVFSPGAEFSPVKVSPRKIRLMKGSSTALNLGQTQRSNLSTSVITALTNPTLATTNDPAPTSDLGQNRGNNISSSTVVAASTNPALTVTGLSAALPNAAGAVMNTGSAPTSFASDIANGASAATTNINNQQRLSSIPVFFGNTRRDPPNADIDDRNPTPTSTARDQQAQGPSQNSLRGLDPWNFITPKRRGRRGAGRGGHEAGDGQGGPGRGEYAGIVGHNGRGAQLGGYAVPGAPGGGYNGRCDWHAGYGSGVSHAAPGGHNRIYNGGYDGRGGYVGAVGQAGYGGQDRGNSVRSYGAPLFPALMAYEYQPRSSVVSAQQWTQQMPPPSSAALQPYPQTPSRPTVSPGGTVNTPSAFFSPFPSYNPPTPTPLSRPGYNHDPQATYVSPLSHLHSLPARTESSLPANHPNRRRSYSFTNPPPEERCLESAIPFTTPQPLLTSTNRPREIATVTFYNSEARDICVIMFEREKVKTEKGRQMMVVENMEGSRVLIVSGPLGSNVRGYLQGIFGPNVHISMSLS